MKCMFGEPEATISINLTNYVITYKRFSVSILLYALTLRRPNFCFNLIVSIPNKFHVKNKNLPKFPSQR